MGYRDGMKKELEQLRDKAKEEITKVASVDALEEFRKKYLGRRGEIARVMKGLKDLASDQKPIVGQIANDVKLQIQEVYDQMLTLLGEKQKISGRDDVFDATLPGSKYPDGRLHPITKIFYEWAQVFREFGFSVVDGPELESEYYNFEALNIPSDHPSRDMWDTIYIKTLEHKSIKTKEQNRLLLRTHTSPVQVRAMERYGAPLRIIIPGKVFRYEATDARHEHTFHQVEGLMIDREVSLSHLITIMKEIVKKLTNDESINLRVRPGFFPFTEPSIEFDLSCLLCKQKGCAVCKHTGWLEFGGAGLVHPRVIRAGGLDPRQWNGFAFGMGPARLLMLKYGIDDIRLFNSGDLRFLKQF